MKPKRNPNMKMERRSGSCHDWLVVFIFARRYLYCRVYIFILYIQYNIYIVEVYNRLILILILILIYDIDTYNYI